MAAAFLAAARLWSFCVFFATANAGFFAAASAFFATANAAFFAAASAFFATAKAAFRNNGSAFTTTFNTAARRNHQRRRPRLLRNRHRLLRRCFRYICQLEQLLFLQRRAAAPLLPPACGQAS
jgi:hypothetical protein